MAPALLRQAVYGTIKYGLYYTLKDVVTSSQIGCGEESAIINISLAVVSGAISSAVANPTDVLKVRMQSGKSIRPVDCKMTPNKVSGDTRSFADTKEYACGKRIKMVAAYKDIYLNEGVGGLWRGVCPTAQRAALVAGVQLPVYDMAKVFFIRHDIIKESPVNNLASSIVAGFCACMASSPMDVIRTRMMDQKKIKKYLLNSAPSSTQNESHHELNLQNNRFSKKIPAMSSSHQVDKLYSSIPSTEATMKNDGTEGGSAKYTSVNRIYRSTLECAVATVRNEGFGALYRGFVPAFMRMGPWNIIFFLVYEQLKIIS